MPVPMEARAAGRLVVLFLLAFSVLGCAGRPGTPGWGAEATVTPGWDRLGRAALAAASDPFTWVPAAGAAALQLGDLDNEIADWANEETPLFGSRGAADDASDWLRRASYASYVLTGLAAPVAPGESWIAAKAQGFVVGGAAFGATELVTQEGKEAAGRERPLGQNDRSFPSRHASLTAVSARLSRETLRYYDLPPGARLAADAGLAGLTALTGWARLEGGRHHPADVLAGAALGNFFAVFMTEAFLHPATGEAIALGAEAYGKGLTLNATINF